MLDAFPNADKVLRGFLIVESRRSDLKKVNDVIQWFCSFL